jgi:hypothetical protein
MRSFAGLEEKYMANMKSDNKGSNWSSRLIWIVALLLLLIVVAAVVIGITGSIGETPALTEPVQQSEPVTEQTTEATEPVTEAPTEASSEPTEETTEPTFPVIIPTFPQSTTPPKTVINLPYTIPGTTLVIQRVANYSGIYLEDGSNSDVTDVAMMLLYNAGSQAVEFADCRLVYDDKTLEFKISALPAGGKIAVQEFNGQSCASGDLTECRIDIATMDKMEMSENLVNVMDNGNNTLTITNLSEQDIATVRIFYKYYLADEDAYIGGIAFSSALHDLKAGESYVLMPNHFSSSGSVVIMVRTYDTVA